MWWPPLRASHPVSPHPAPGAARGAEGGTGGRRCACVGLCVIERRGGGERERERLEYVFEWESLICGPMYGSLPPRAGQSGAGRRAPNWAQMAATDRDGGDINTLINNYPNNDTLYTSGGGRGGQKERGRQSARKSGAEDLRRPAERSTERVKEQGGREGGGEKRE